MIDEEKKIIWYDASVLKLMPQYLIIVNMSEKHLYFFKLVREEFKFLLIHYKIKELNKISKNNFKLNYYYND